MMRLDQLLVNQNLSPSRNKAYELIKNGKVMVNQKIITKPSFEANQQDSISIIVNEVLKYVSRGGLKLQKALEVFKVNFSDLTILDIGASTGGFSDCSLKYGAKKVYCLDVGVNQLHESLRNHPKIVNIENTNFKDLNESIVDPKMIDFYVCDVSFISITTILRKLKEFSENFSIIILYKPQFEVGKNNLNAKGVVKDKKAIIESLINFNDFLNSLNIGILNSTFSPILGNKEGNIEFLFYLRSNYKSINVDFYRLVNEAVKVLKVKKC